MPKKSYSNIDIQNKDVLSTKLNLKDGKHTLKEVIDYTEKSMNEFNKFQKSEFEYFVNAANILKVDDNLQACHKVKNIQDIILPQ